MAKTVIIPYTARGETFAGLKYTIPDPKDPKDVFGWDITDKKEQYWKRPPIPNFHAMTKAEKDAYFEKELIRSAEGAHFWNNGKIEYLAPVHYWFLMHWDLGGGKYPKFYKWHQHLGWFMHLCRTDPNCFGGFVLASKRSGKSEFIPCEFQCDAMLQTKAEYIMQAQNDLKAKKLFRRSLGAFYSQKRSLPYTYQYYTTKSEIMFKKVDQQKKSTKKDMEEDFAVSNHVAIGAYPSKIDFVQGETTRGYFLDESCSQELMDLEELHAKVLAQCREGIGKKIVGKSWWISTPENATAKAIKYSEVMWKGSNPDPKVLDGNGRTKSGLYGMLVPYYVSTPDFIDKYGYADEEAAKTFFQNMYDAGNESEKKQLRRQYITCEADCFQSLTGDILEQDNKENLTEHLETLKLNPSVSAFGKFDTENKKLVFFPKSFKKKDYEAQKKLFEIIEPPHPNCKYVIGIDGTNTSNETSDSKKSDKSDFAIVVIKLYEGEKFENYKVVALWAAYPDRMEDALKAAWQLTVFYNQFPDDNYHNRAIKNLEVFVEGNVGIGDAICAYYRNHGCYHLIPDTPKEFGTDKSEKRSKKTVYADQHVNAERKRLLNIWERRYWRNHRSERMVEDLIKRGNADLRSAYTMGLLGCGKFDVEHSEKKAKPPQLQTTFKYEMDSQGRLKRVTVQI